MKIEGHKEPARQVVDPTRTEVVSQPSEIPAPENIIDTQPVMETVEPPIEGRTRAMGTFNFGRLGIGLVVYD